MRELKASEVSSVSGGSLTSMILDFFKNLNAPSQEEKTEWIRPDAIPDVSTVSGHNFGMGIFGLGVTVAFGLLFF
ncbi:hypothetical protein [Pantoea brenneri]|uniref:hypothetical protein n=1 Tax=Pantoea brenneri TaxID=472694 RepID=UPI0028A0DCA9|nr:hypothetical protein [Pantoea brenneri]